MVDARKGERQAPCGPIAQPRVGRQRAERFKAEHALIERRVPRMDGRQHLVEPRSTRRLRQQPHQADQHRFARQAPAGRRQRRRIPESPVCAQLPLGLQRKQEFARQSRPLCL